MVYTLHWYTEFDLKKLAKNAEAHSPPIDVSVSRLKLLFSQKYYIIKSMNNHSREEYGHISRVGIREVAAFLGVCSTATLLTACLGSTSGSSVTQLAKKAEPQYTQVLSGNGDTPSNGKNTFTGNFRFASPEQGTKISYGIFLAAPKKTSEQINMEANDGTLIEEKVGIQDVSPVDGAFTRIGGFAPITGIFTKNFPNTTQTDIDLNISVEFIAQTTDPSNQEDELRVAEINKLLPDISWAILAEPVSS
jgi:hypothetical protein